MGEKKMPLLPGIAVPAAEDHSRRSGLSVLPPAWGVFDLETARSADEVGGWNRADLMGVSVGVVYDFRSDSFVSYFELVVGFNNKRFDNQVLRGYTRDSLDRLPSLDLLEEVQKKLGFRLKLDNLAAATLGATKSGDGLQALQWYREGRVERIEKYCRQDVKITRDLFLHGLEKGWLLFTDKDRKKVHTPAEPRSSRPSLRSGAPCTISPFSAGSA